MNTHHLLFKATGGALLTFLFATAVFAADRQQLELSATKTMINFSSDNSVHYELTQKAAGVLVFPHITKAAAGAEAEIGEGVLMVDGKSVGVYKLSAGTTGTTAGIPERSEVVLFMTPEALQQFIDSKVWTVGVDAEVSVASRGAAGDYNSESLKKPIIAFAFAEQGFITDVSLTGARISRVPA